MRPPMSSSMPCASCIHNLKYGCRAQRDGRLILTPRWHGIRSTLDPAPCLSYVPRADAPPAWTWHIAAHA